MANEKRLIDANAVLVGIETFMQCYAEIEEELTPFRFKVAIQALEMVRQLIKEMPTVDAVEVVHGRWIWDNRFHDYTCSECHNWDLKTPNYCSNCGAKMMGLEEDDDC